MILSRSVADRSSFNGKSFISWLYLCTRKRWELEQPQHFLKRDLPWSVASFNPVSAMKLTVAWKRLAFLKQSMTILTSSLRSWATMPSSARSNVNQKLISWEAVPDATSLFNLVTDWMDLIHALTWPWRVLRNVLSFSSLAGICEIFGRVPAACAWQTPSWIK